MLFYGPPGTGKTSTILALSKQLFGPDLFRSRVLELNASDERGINIVRTKIKDFARQQLSSAPAGPAGEEYMKKYPCPPFKIIVLDEADSMTQDAQSALRRTMENYSRITRFCLICNYVTRIIDPLASRCSKFRFKSLDGGDAVARIAEIARLEGVPLEDGVPEALARCAEGDLRRAITFLQSCARLVGAAGREGPGHMGRGKKRKSGKKDPDAMDIDSTGDGKDKEKERPEVHPVTVSIVEEIAGVIPTSAISGLSAAIKPAQKEATNLKSNASNRFNAITTSVTGLIKDGWPATQILSQLYEELIVQDESVGDKEKVRMLEVFGEADKRLCDGGDEECTILGVGVGLAGCF